MINPLTPRGLRWLRDEVEGFFFFVSVVTAHSVSLWGCKLHVPTRNPSIMSSKSYFRYWGKAKPQDGCAAQFHLLPYHCLDVAAVGLQYLRRSPAFSRLLCQQLHWKDETVLEGWVAFWLAMHDLGKFSEAFQSQRPDLFTAIRGRVPDASKVYTLRHDSLGMLFWKDKLAERAAEERWFGPQTEYYECGLDYWARAATGHHGQPPQEDGSWYMHFHRHDDPAAIFEFTTDIRNLIFAEQNAAIPTMLDAGVLRMGEPEPVLVDRWSGRSRGLAGLEYGLLRLSGRTRRSAVH
jgi:CRISPR-associated endonuclease Cas3-HD